MTPDFERMARDVDSLIEKAAIDVPTLPCQKCGSKGYHHGFAEDGRDPDWCGVCDGSGFVVDEKEYERRQLAPLIELLRKVHTDALESAAKVADHLNGWGSRDGTAQHIAECIRALATKEPRNGND